MGLFAGLVAERLARRVAAELGLVEQAKATARRKKRSAGVVVVEPDGRVWVREVRGGFGGYKYSFAKGRVDPGESPRAAAVREVAEEMGFQVRVDKWLTDAVGDFTVTRFYVGHRTAGEPVPVSAETTALHCVTLDEAAGMLNRERDQAVLEATRRYMERSAA